MNDGDVDHIKHVIVLMLENRSFDQMLGDIPNVEGVQPTHRNDLNGKVYTQKPSARNEVPVDPVHLHPNVMFQVSNSGGNFVKDYWCEHKAKKIQPNYDDIMDYFSQKGPNRLNALHTLGTAFTVCDHWFSSVPGPTWPNRFFAHSGTSMGYVCMPEPPRYWEHLHATSYRQQTIYRQLTNANVSWKIYYHDVPQSLMLQDLRAQKDHFYPIGSFFDDAAGDASQFPQYSFIEPRYGYGAFGILFGISRPFKTYQFLNAEPDETKLPNDDHPPHTVDQGQNLIGDVYHALLDNAELWASTLLIVLYDEHGGFYDHIHDLPSAAPPDNRPSETIKYQYPCGNLESFAFRFERLGVRVPAVLISPWVKRVHVCSTIFDHTSILKYVSDKWLRPDPTKNPPYLTARVEKTNSIAEALGGGPGPDLPAPRIERRIDVAIQDLAIHANQPLNDHQEALVAMTETLPEQPGEELVVNDLERMRRREESRELDALPLAKWALATARVDAFMTLGNELTL